MLPDVRSFLNPIPHVSFVHGADNVDYLRAPPRGAGQQPAVRVDGVHRRPRRVRPPAAVDGREARLLRSGRAELDPGRHRRRLRFAVAAADRVRRAAGHGDAVRPRRPRPAQEVRRHAGRSRSSTGAPAQKRKFNAKFVFVGAGGGALPLLQKAGIKEAKGFGGFPVGGQFLRSGNPVLTAATPGQGVRPAAARRTADVGAAPGHPRHQRQVVAAVRSVRRLVAEVPQAGQGHRPAVLGQARTTWSRCWVSGSPRWALLKYLIGQLLLSEADRVDASAGIRARRSRFRLGARHRRPARAGDPQGEGQGRRAGVRHHRALGRRRQHRRPARRLARRVDRGAGHARRHGALLRRPLPGRGSPSSRRWCRRWASNCPTSRSCSKRCGSAAPRSSSWTSRPAACPATAGDESTAGTEHSPTAASV